MAISKRLRYEVLRRDNHTCRYCGATAPDATITVDHVTPVALGGTDDPGTVDNILAAGLPLEILLECVDITLGNRYVKDEFRYLCGVAWNRVHQMQEIALSLLASEDEDGR